MKNSTLLLAAIGVSVAFGTALGVLITPTKGAELTWAQAAELLPPKEFDPMFRDDRMLGTYYSVTPKPHAEIQRICTGPTVKTGYAANIPVDAWACTDILTSHIFIDQDLRGDVKSLIMRHELAHILGWRHE